MKKLHTKIIAILLVLSAAAFSGCGNTSSESSDTSKTELTTQATQETTAPSQVTDDSLMSLLGIDRENGDEFAGEWKIAGGEGSQFKKFTFCFDGNGKASLVLDNAGYFGKYELKGENGKKRIKTQLVYGLNGEYTYKFSEDKSQVVLTLIEDSSTTTIERVKDFNCVPSPGKTKIDKALLGAWKSENEESFYFAENGVMYHNLYNTMFNYAVYLAENSKINAVYKMESDMTEEYEYSVKGDTLTIDGFEYKRVDASEL